jgi:hypothetical protein
MLLVFSEQALVGIALSGKYTPLIYNLSDNFLWPHPTHAFAVLHPGLLSLDIFNHTRGIVTYCCKKQWPISTTQFLALKEMLKALDSNIPNIRARLELRGWCTALSRIW